MRDFASCFSDYAVQVSDTSCSGHSSASCISPAAAPSVQTAAVSLYRHSLPSGKHLLISLSWTRTALSHSLAVTFNDSAAAAFRLTANPRRNFRKPKGSKALELQNISIEIFWDLSSARFGPGPEPLDGFYLFFTVDSDLGPAIGDLSRDALSKRLRPEARTAKSSLISRQEHFSGSAAQTARARFCDAGSGHEVSIQCDGAAAMSVCVDKRTVVRVKRLQWNFRGNQTVFVDGLLVDLMWDVHDWVFGPGRAVFMFRTRSGMDSRLWLEEKMERDKLDFSLMIYLRKSE